MYGIERTLFDHYVRAEFFNFSGALIIFAQFLLRRSVQPENAHSKGKDLCTASLQYNCIGFVQTRNMLNFDCIETSESKPVKQETCCTLMSECCLVQGVTSI